MDLVVCFVPRILKSDRSVIRITRERRKSRNRSKSSSSFPHLLNSMLLFFPSSTPPKLHQKPRDFRKGRLMMRAERRFSAASSPLILLFLFSYFGLKNFLYGQAPFCTDVVSSPEKKKKKEKFCELGVPLGEKWKKRVTQDSEYFLLTEPSSYFEEERKPFNFDLGRRKSTGQSPMDENFRGNVSFPVKVGLVGWEMGIRSQRKAL